MLENLKSKISGIPLPEKYDQYYITKYSFPKGLNTVKGITKVNRKYSNTKKNKSENLFRLRRDKKNGTYYLKTKKNRIIEGFRGLN